MILADHLGETLRAQPIRERARNSLLQTGRLEEAGHHPIERLNKRPPRWIPIRQADARALAAARRSATRRMSRPLTLDTMSPGCNPMRWAIERGATDTTTTPDVASSSESSSISA